MSTELTKPGINQITLKINPPVEVVGGVEVVRDDLSLVKVWMSETAGFTPSASNLVYSGKELQTTITQLQDGTPVEVGTSGSPKQYYLKYALISSIDPSVEDVLTLADAVAPLNTDLVTIDFTNPPNIPSLTATAGYSLITVTWTAPSYTNAGGHNYTRIYALKRTGTEAAKPYNDPSAIQFDIYNTNTFVHSVELGETWYYYAVYVGKNGLSSATPAGPTSFVSSALDVGYVLGELSGQISQTQLAQDLLTPIASGDKLFEDNFELDTLSNWTVNTASQIEILRDQPDAKSGGAFLRIDKGNTFISTVYSSAKIPIDEDSYYHLEVTVRSGGTDNYAAIKAGYIAYAEDGVTRLGPDGTEQDATYPIIANLEPVSVVDGWVTFKAFLKGYSNPAATNSGTETDPATTHPSVKYISPYLNIVYTGDCNIVDVDSFKIYDETYAATSRIEVNQTTDTLGSRYTVKIDNAGYVSGFGLASETNTYDPNSATQSTFGINASTFYVAPQGYASDTEPAGPGIPDGFVWIDTSGETNVIKYWNDTDYQWETGPLTYPFVVKTAPFTLGDTTYPPGVYMDSAYIVDLNADNITAGTLSADRVDARSLTIGYDQIDGDDKPEPGATRNVFVGAWASGIDYEVGDIVTDDTGYGWSCIQAHTSSSTITTPQYPNTNAYWKVYTVKGDPGESITGPQGTRGTVQIVATGTSWDDGTANSAIQTFTGSPDNSTGEYNVRGDQVTISGGTFSQTKYWDGTAWLNRDAYINGNLLVSGSITGDRIATGTLVADNLISNSITQELYEYNDYFADYFTTGDIYSYGYTQPTFIKGSTGYSETFTMPTSTVSNRKYLVSFDMEYFYKTVTCSGWLAISVFHINPQVVLQVNNNGTWEPAQGYWTNAIGGTFPNLASYYEHSAPVRTNQTTTSPGIYRKTAQGNFNVHFDILLEQGKTYRLAWDIQFFAIDGSDGSVELPYTSQDPTFGDWGYRFVNIETYIKIFKV